MIYSCSFSQLMRFGQFFQLKSYKTKTKSSPNGLSCYVAISR